MALTSNLERTSITAVSDGSSLTVTSNWTDNTTYGGVNPLRAGVAVYLTAYKVDEDQVETALEVTTTQTGTTPNTNTTFSTINYTQDGWHRYYFIIVPLYDILVTYNKYDMVWDSSEEAFYQYINDIPSAGQAVTDTAYFIPVTDPTAKIQDVGTASEPGNITYQVIDKVVDYLTSICYLRAASLYAKECCDEDCTGDCDSKLTRAYKKIAALFTNLALNESQGLFLEGEKNAQSAAKYCDDCGCLTR